MIGEFPKRVTGRGRLLAAGLAAAALASAAIWILGSGAVALVGAGSGGVAALALHPVFRAGVALVATVQVLDQSLIGLLRGGLHLWRNAAFAIAKLATLVVVGLLVAQAGELLILVSWVVGLALSFAFVGALLRT